MKNEISRLFKTSVMSMFFMLPNAFAESSESPDPGQDGDVRIELLTALELQLSVAESLGRDDLVASLSKSIDEVQYASEADLAPIEGAIDEVRNHTIALQQLESAIQEAAARRAPSSGKFPITTQAKFSNTTNSVISPTSLTGPDYYTGATCTGDINTGGRNDTQAVLTASIAVGTAKVAWAAVEVACGLDVVALASGGLGTAACAVLAAAVAAAEEVLEAFNRCDATVDEAHLDAAYNRAEDNFDLGTHIHSDLSSHDQNIDSDLATHDTNVNANLDQHDTDINANLDQHDTDINANLDQHDTDIKTQVTTHDTDIKTQVTNHDNDIKSQVAVHDSDIKAQLTTHDLEIKARLDNIQGSVNENQRLIKVSMSRQLEVMRLLITPEGQREINPAVLSCTGDDCPTANEIFSCKDGLDWPCK